MMDFMLHLLGQLSVFILGRNVPENVTFSTFDINKDLLSLKIFDDDRHHFALAGEFICPEDLEFELFAHHDDVDNIAFAALDLCNFVLLDRVEQADLVQARASKELLLLALVIEIQNGAVVAELDALDEVDLVHQVVSDALLLVLCLVHCR